MFVNDPKDYAQSLWNAAGGRKSDAKRLLGEAIIKWHNLPLSYWAEVATFLAGMASDDNA